jgi:ABC-type branched-subunit amino acid transport system substrate-binding protein
LAYVPLDAGGVTAPFEGMVVSTLLPARSPAAEGFAARHRVRFGSEPENPSYTSYGAVGLIGQALAHGAAIPAGLQRYLRGLGRELRPSEGVTGELSFDARGDAREATFSLARVSNGRLVAVAP